MRLEKGLEDKENAAPATKRSKVEAYKESESPYLKMSKTEAYKEEQGAGLTLKEVQVFPESKRQAFGDHVGQESTGTEPETAEVDAAVPGEEIVHEEGRGIVEEMDNPEAAMIEIEFESAELETPIETVANRYIPGREEDALAKDKKEEEEENSEEELERSLAAEMYEVTVEENNRLDEVTKQGAQAVSNWIGNSQQDHFVAVGESCVTEQDLAASKDCLNLMQVNPFGETVDEVGEGEDGDWQWEEVDVEEGGGDEVDVEGGGGDGVEVAEEVTKSTSKEVEFEEVEEVGCTFEKNRKCEDGPETLVKQPEHRLEVKAAVLQTTGLSRAGVEGNKAKIYFVKDAVAEDSLWDEDEEDSKEENLREEVHPEELREEVLKNDLGVGEANEEELGELKSKDELNDVVTISVQDCTVLNLDVALAAPEIFNIPGNFKEQVIDEFSSPASASKPTKRKGRPAKISRRKRSKD